MMDIEDAKQHVENEADSVGLYLDECRTYENEDGNPTLKVGKWINGEEVSQEITFTEKLEMYPDSQIKDELSRLVSEIYQATLDYETRLYPV